MRKLAHLEIPRPSPEELETLPAHPITVVLDNIRSIYNVGSIFRTSDAARIEKLWLTGYTGTPAHRGIHKTALGAQDTVPWESTGNPKEVIEQFRKKGYTIAALEITDTPMFPAQLQPAHFPLCLLIGNEVSGVQAELVEMADLALEIPQFGAKQSLNVSVAFGIGIFDIVRRYRALFHADELPPLPQTLDTLPSS